MKTYFAKYLPVDLEIKEGDIFICTQPHGDRYTASSVKNGYVYTSPLSFRFRIGDCKIVKLFLCSRDNSEYKQEILTEGIKEGQEFTEQEKDYLTLL